jgi:VIT1/CCC1 family predicted Fe2+/Mn2+ transporter
MTTSENKIELRDIILGGQDGLVNVLGISLGLFAAHSPTHLIIVAGLVAGVSEAISMGAVAYTSSESDKDRIQRVGHSQIFFGSVVVGISAFVGAIIPIIPFLLPSDIITPIGTAIVLSGLVLFYMGMMKARAVGGRWWRSGLQILLIGLVSAFAGFLIGLAVK